MISAVNFHGCNSIKQLDDVSKNPDIIGGELDIMCGNKSPGLFLGHHYYSGQIELILKKHHVEPFLVDLGDVIDDYPKLELVLDLKTKNAESYLNNFHAYAWALVNRVMPFYVFPGVNVEIQKELRTYYPLIRMSWLLNNPPFLMSVPDKIAGDIPYDHNSYYVSADQLPEYPKKINNVRHLNIGFVTARNVETICHSLISLSKKGKESFVLERVSFSSDEPAAVAKALLRHGKQLFNHHLTQTIFNDDVYIPTQVLRLAS